MPRVAPTDLTPDSFYGTLGHRPEIMRAWQAMDEAMMGPGSTLSAELKENVRRSLSQSTGCRYCASFGDPDADRGDPTESLAVAFAEMVAKDHQSIDDSTFDVLREDLSEEQLVKLCAWLCFKLGANVFGALMRLEPANEDQKASYEGWLGEREPVSG